MILVPRRFEVDLTIPKVLVPAPELAQPGAVAQAEALAGVRRAQLPARAEQQRERVHSDYIQAKAMSQPE